MSNEKDEEEEEEEEKKPDQLVKCIQLNWPVFL
jgi:hypothetical protein